MVTKLTKRELTICLVCIIFGVTVSALVFSRQYSDCTEGTFVDAVLHAGSTDFLFEIESGLLLMLRSETDNYQLVGKEMLIGVADDGPAEANPAMIGQDFSICFADDKTRIMILD